MSHTLKRQALRPRDLEKERHLEKKPSLYGLNMGWMGPPCFSRVREEQGYFKGKSIAMDHMTKRQLAGAELCVIERGKPAREARASSRCSINNYDDIIFVIYLGEGTKNSSIAHDARHNLCWRFQGHAVSLPIS